MNMPKHSLNNVVEVEIIMVDAKTSTLMVEDSHLLDDITLKMESKPLKPIMERSVLTILIKPRMEINHSHIKME